MKRVSQSPFLYLVLLLLVSFPSPAISALQFGDIVRKDKKSTPYCAFTDEDGKVCRMTQYSAYKFCSKSGARLPSARDLGVLATSLGAAGIKEKNQHQNGDGYYRVPAVSYKNKEDEFYFRHIGYKPASDESGNYLFWSASLPCLAVFDNNPSPGCAGAFYMSGRNGEIGWDYRDHVHAVRCVKGTAKAIDQRITSEQQKWLNYAGAFETRQINSHAFCVDIEECPTSWIFSGGRDYYDGNTGNAIPTLATARLSRGGSWKDLIVPVFSDRGELKKDGNKLRYSYSGRVYRVGYGEFTLELHSEIETLPSGNIRLIFEDNAGYGHKATYILKRK